MKILYILWAFSRANMAPTPNVIEVYQDKKECIAQVKELKDNIYWQAWDFACVKKTGGGV